MRRPRVLRSGAFRLALAFSLAFALGAIGLFGITKAAVTQYAQSTARTELLDESALLRGEDLLHGTDGVRQLIVKRQHVAAARAFFYRLVDREGRSLAGDLPSSATSVGWGRITVPQPPEAGEPSGEQTSVQTLGVRLKDGALLFVGRSGFDLQELAEWLDRVALWSGIGTTLLALGGGYLIAAIFLRRLERVNYAAQRIMDGRLDTRVPAIGMGEEYDHLAANLNRMLDRIQALTTGLRQVSTNIAHDLRTPLTRLRHHLEAVEQLQTGEPGKAALAEAVAQLDQVLSTFGALLRLSQIEGGAGKSRFAPVNLSELLERLRLAYAPAAEDAGQTLTADLVQNASVLGDSELLTQLFANLIENALTHAGPAATVRLSLAHEAGRFRASVADNGPGVPNEERSRVLEPLYRLDASRGSAGSGLGLALASAIAELHGAKLELLDNAPGLQARLTFAERSAA